MCPSNYLDKTDIIKDLALLNKGFFKIQFHI